MSLIVIQKVMADSVYISTNLTRKQLEFVRLLDEKEIDIFMYVNIAGQLNTSFDNLSEILENLVDKKVLERIEKGKYCRSNFNDEKTIGCFISFQGAIAYWSALNAHGLTEQFPNKVFIQTTRLKKNKTVFGTAYKFVKVAEYKIAGIIVQGQGNRKYQITDIEKTIVDCFDLLEYSGGYAELIRAFNQARLSSDKMIAYTKSIDNIAAIKRLGFLAELLNKNGLTPFIKYARQRVNVKYNLFDPAGYDTGQFVNSWRLRLNISREKILDICNTQY